MRVLHIPPSFENKPRWKQLFYYPLRQKIDFWGTPGFFYASFYEAFGDVDRRSAEWVLKNADYVNKNYDFVLSDLRLDTKFLADSDLDLAHRKLIDALSVPKVLFHLSDSAERLMPDDILDGYNLVFKREPYKDRSKYNISDGNKDKILPTMLSCPFVFHPVHTILNPLKSLLEPRPISEEEYQNHEHDVFFSGIVSPKNKIRETAWKALIETPDIKTLGGLQDRDRRLSKYVADPTLKGPKLSRQQYVESIRKSKIGLALDGWGEFTFRHLELWYMGAFMICSSNINEQELLLPAEEGKHYVTYNDIDDLVEKVRYYRAHDEQRLEIAKAGRKLFEDFYDTKKHGRNVKEEVYNLLKNKNV